MKTIKLASLKPNPDNPRYITEDKFEALKLSIRDFPEMMALRPLVVDDQGTVLGGNMRLKALAELGYQDIPAAWVIKAKDLTEEQRREFVVKDNIGSVLGIGMRCRTSGLMPRWENGALIHGPRLTRSTWTSSSAMSRTKAKKGNTW